MKTKILNMLRSKKTYVSGQEICNELGVSRTAVWKCMNQLKEEGYTIEAVSNKGYCLKECPDLVTEYEINSILQGTKLIDEILYYEEIDSTNNKAKQLGNEGDQRQLLVIADTQTNGRGRRGRTWESPKGMDIYMSFKLQPKIKPSNASMVTLVAALALVDAIKSATDLEPKIKWPNDIVINGHKVCGILTEMSSELDYVHYIVVGIGINVNAESFPEEIRHKATSLYIESKQKIKRASLVAKTIQAFEKYYDIFLKTQDLSQLIEPYNEYLVHKGQTVKIVSLDEETVGVAEGIDKDGSLLVRLEDNTVKKVISGEVSVRGIYGYV